MSEKYIFGDLADVVFKEEMGREPTLEDKRKSIEYENIINKKHEHRPGYGFNIWGFCRWLKREEGARKVIKLQGKEFIKVE